MNKEEFEFLNALSIKAVKDTLTSNELNELNEFKRLLTIWNDNLLQSSYIANVMV